jgi:transketolase
MHKRRKKPYKSLTRSEGVIIMVEFKLNEKMNLVEDVFSDELKKGPTRDGWGKALLALGKKDENVVALTADLSGSVRTNWFEKQFPERFFNVGVAEQNMAGVAAGLAMSKKTVFFSSFAVFSPGRNWDQIRVNIAYNNLDVKFSGAHAGITTGPDGATHQALEDIAIMRVLPNITVLVPSDEMQAYKAAERAYEKKGPVYIRLGRENIPNFTTENTPFDIGKINVLKDGSDIAIVACGVEVFEALKAAKELADEGIDVAVLDCHTIKPIDKNTLIHYAKKCKKMVVAEEHQINGGLFSAISEVLVQQEPITILPVGVKDKFGESGDGFELLKEYGLDFESIKNKCKELIHTK